MTAVGTVVKTDNGWIVREYDGKHPAYKEIPLHPKDVEMMDTCFTNKFTREISFMLVTIDDTSYAKLTGVVPS